MSLHTSRRVDAVYASFDRGYPVTIDQVSAMFGRSPGAIRRALYNAGARPLEEDTRRGSAHIMGRSLWHPFDVAVALWGRDVARTRVVSIGATLATTDDDDDDNPEHVP